MSNISIDKYQTIKIEYDEKIKYVTLWMNRPSSFNALNSQFFIEIVQAFKHIEELMNQVDIRCILLRGTGKHFCVGLDLKDPSFFDIQQEDIARKSRILYDKLRSAQQAVSILSECRIPVISYTHGYTIGGGCDLITAADIRVASVDCIFQIAEITIAQSPDMGTVQRLPQIAKGDSKIRELIFTGRQFNSSQAKQFGFISDIFKKGEEESELKKLISEITTQSPVGIYAIKQALNFSSKQIYHHLDYMARLNSAMLLSTDVELAMMSKLKKQKLEYPKL